MDNIGLIIIINKYDKHFTTYEQTFICSSIDDAKNKLIDYLANNLLLEIDYPMSLEQFEYIWFSEQYVNTNAFSYKIFSNKWDQPWTLDEIYLDVIDKIVDNDNNNPPDFTKLYGEPDETSDNDDKDPNDKFFQPTQHETTEHEV